MNTASLTPSPNVQSANVPESPRKKSIPPPLPRWAPAPQPSSGFLRSGSPAGGSGGSLHPVILSTTPIDAPELHHRWSNSAKLISIGIVALLVTSMLIRSHEGSGGPQMLQAGFLASKPPVVMTRQVVELDEVLIEGALYDKENIQGNAAFDVAAALSSIRSVGASSDECGLEAVGSVNVVVIFAPSGEATTVEIEDGPLRGTQTGSCVARRLLHARVAEFDGERETVRTSVVLR